MDNWGVYLVILSLLGFLAIVMPPVLKLNGNITRLNIMIDQMKIDHTDLKSCHKEDVLKIKEEQDKKLSRAYNRLEKVEALVAAHDKKIDDHEKRLMQLEDKT